MKVNINDDVKVKLTAIGKLELERQHGLLQKMFPHIGCIEMPVEDNEGWSIWQLWRLMETFGSMLYNGGRVPFETEIEIEGKVDEATLDKLRDAVIDAEYNYLKGLKEAFQSNNLGFDEPED